jgi:hypothetical protein
MALLRNGANLYDNSHRYFSASGQYGLLKTLDGGPAKGNWHAGEHKITNVTDRSAVPEGYAPGNGAWLMAQKAGGLGSRSEANFSITGGDLNLAEGRNIDGTTTITFSVPDAQLQLVVSAVGTAAITFTVPDATLAGALEAVGSTSFTITVPNATLGAVIDAVATASFAFSGAGTATAYGWLEGDITPFTTLSPENLAASVWGSLLEGNYTAQDLMKILVAVAAGKTNITDLGGGLATVEFRDLQDTLNRVVADMTNSERTDVTLDVS